MLPLQNTIPGYLNWARQSRQWVANTTASRVLEQVEALDAASLAAFTSLHNKFDGIDARLQAVENSLGRISTAVCATIPQKLDRLELAGPSRQVAIPNGSPTVPRLGPEQQQQQSQEEQPPVVPPVIAVAVGGHSGKCLLSSSLLLCDETKKLCFLL